MDYTLVRCLITLPLFQGMSVNDINRLFSDVRIDPITKKRGSTIVPIHSPCDFLVFVIEGTVLAEKADNNCLFHLQEYMTAPLVLQPECLFGRNIYYTHEFQAATTARVLYIKKDLVLQCLFKSDVFRFNLLNVLCTQIQRNEQHLWLPAEPTLEYRFVYFVRSLATTPVGKKIIKVKMADLASQLHTARLNVSQMLHRLSNAGLIELRRNAIHIPNLENLPFK